MGTADLEEVKTSNTVFKGYNSDSEEEFVPKERTRAAPVAKRDHYPVIYSCQDERNPVGPVAAKLVFVGNRTNGGFKVHNDDASVPFFKIEWQDTMWFEFNDEQTTVRLNEKKQKFVKFTDTEGYYF